jgi:hypothetical protein
MQTMPHLLCGALRRRLWLNAPTLAALAGLVLAASTCARDINAGQEIEEPFPLQFTIGMEVAEDAALTNAPAWYYMVFNFSNVPQPQSTKNPVDQIANELRGRNWELYISFHRDENGIEEILTDQRTRLPTLLRTATNPVDAGSGSFNPTTDMAPDIVAITRAGGTVELFLGEINDITDNNFFLASRTINTGPAPMRVFTGGPNVGQGSLSQTPFDFNADSRQDLLVIFAGTGPGSAFIRPLLSNGDGTFTAGTETPIAGIPVDAVLADVDPPETGLATLDLVILTVDAPGGAGTVRSYLGGTAGAFTAGPTVAVGSDPTQIAGGAIDADDLDLAVANAGDDTISVLFGDGAGGFTVEDTLDVPGEVHGVSVNTMFGTGGDVAFTYSDATNAGFTGVYLRETDGDFGATPLTQTLERPVDGPIVTFDAGKDNRIDVVAVDRLGGGADGNFLIEPTIRVDSTTPGGPEDFGWNDTPIVYGAGSEPFRPVPTDIDADGDIDLLIPSAGGGDSGNNIAVFYALGRYNYTNDDIYWTDALDAPPQNLTEQPWYVSHSFTGNRMEVTIDATQFFDLTQLPPEELLRGQTSREFFQFDLMTGDYPIDLRRKENETFGIVREHFTQPVSVPMTIGHLDNEVTSPRVAQTVAPAALNITDWFIEVN